MAQEAVPFVGPSYQSYSSTIDNQRSVNLYLEKTETTDGKSKMSLIGTPGRTLFCSLPTNPVRGEWEATDRGFVVSGNKLYEIFSNGTFTARGTLLTSFGSVGMADNGLQLAIVDGLNLYIFTLATNVFSVNPAGGTWQGSNTVSFIDGSFVFVKPVSNLFYMSNLYDGTTISGLNEAQKAGAPDNVVTTINDHRILWVLGEQTTEAWYDAGTPIFGYAPIQGIFLEVGCVAPFSVVKHDNSVFWIGRDKRGQGIVYKIQGFAPIRVSTHAVEVALQSYGDLSAATAHSYQEEGHSFLVLNGPNWPTTWVYDSAVGGAEGWHERQSFDVSSSRDVRERVNTHMYCFGQHIMGDRTNGQLYSQALGIYTDNGNQITRIRRSPHYWSNLKRIFYKFFQLDMEPAVGLDGVGVPINGVQPNFEGFNAPDNTIDGIAPGKDPMVGMRYSNDGGKTFNDWRYRKIGRIGETRRRTYWNKLGWAYDRVYEVKITDPVKVVIVNAIMDPEQSL